VLGGALAETGLAGAIVAITYLVCSFLLASTPTGLIVTALWTDMDIRAAGSGNVGATNVYRLAGRTLGIVTLTGDVLKGLLPVLLSHWLLGGPWGVSATILVAFLGHCYSPFLAFRGGKGVATGIGGFLAAVPLASVIAVGAWVGVVAYTRRSSLAALVALAMLLTTLALLPPARPYLPVAGVVTVLLIWRHRENIRRLLAGTESTL
jgi:acyl phosphate:glycerol-3-phosphate acyltransferase